MSKGKRRNSFFLICLISYIAVLIVRMVMAEKIGSRGISYISIPVGLFMVFGFSLGYAIEQGVSVLVDNRINKQMYENAKRILKTALVLALAFSVVLCAALFGFGEKIVCSFFNMPMSLIPVYLMIPALPLTIIASAVKGYISGVGNNKISDNYNIIFVVVYILSGLFFGFIFNSYGLKVSKLLKQDNYKYVYNAIGVSLGLLLASFVALLFILIMYILLDRRTDFGEGRDYYKSMESMKEQTGLLILNMLPYFGIFETFAVSCFLNCIFIFRNMDAERSMEYSFGEYLGKVSSIVHIVAMFLLILLYTLMRRTVSSAYREEHRSSRERLGRLVHRTISIGLFSTSIVIVFADNILNTIFSGNAKDTVKFLEIEGICIALTVLAVLLIKMLMMLRYINLAAVICVVSLIVHIILLFVFVVLFKWSVVGVILSNIVTYLLIGASGFAFITRIFQYTQEWFRSFLVPLISSLVMGIVGVFINRVLSQTIGKSLTMYITIVICSIVYIITALLLKGYTEEELEESPVGRLILFIGKHLRLL